MDKFFKRKKMPNVNKKIIWMKLNIFVVKSTLYNQF